MPMQSKRVAKNKTENRSGFYKFYADVTADIDLYTEGPFTGSQMPCAEIHVMTTGTLVVERVDGTQVTITDIPAGKVLPIEARKIIDSGTTATKLLVLW